MLLPLLSSLLVGLVLPYVLVWSVLSTFGLRDAPLAQQQKGLRWANVFTLLLAGAAAAWHYASLSMDDVTAVLRDEFFLESTELRNFEEAPEQEKEGLDQGVDGPIPDRVLQV